MLLSSPLIFTAIRGCQPGIRGCYLDISGFLQVSVEFLQISVNVISVSVDVRVRVRLFDIILDTAVLRETWLIDQIVLKIDL